MDAAALAELLTRARVGRYVTRADPGAVLDGAEAELNAALGFPTDRAVIPWPVLAEARAATTTAALAGGAALDLLPRVFERGVFRALGVRVEPVPAGRATWAALASGPDASRPAEAAAVATVQTTWRAVTMRPGRVTARVRVTGEALAETAALEPAMRRDIVDAVGAGLSDLVVNGAGGVLAVVADGAAAAEAPSLAGLASLATAVVDGEHAANVDEVSILAPVAFYRTLESTVDSDGVPTGLLRLRERGIRVQATPYLRADGGVAPVVAHAGRDQARGDAVLALWGGVDVIRDPYTRAGSAEVELTATALAAVAVPRTPAFRREDMSA